MGTGGFDTICTAVCNRRDRFTACRLCRLEPQTTHCHYMIYKHNMRHIHTSIVTRYLTTRGNDKILRTAPPHISSTEETLPRLTRIFAQLRTNKSPFLKSFLHKVDAKSHPSPLCHLCKHTQTYIIPSTASNYTPHCYPWICGQIPPE